jgi:mannan endo-1,4-beta-mannosidase
MNSWNIDIAREFAGNVKESPLTGNVLLDARGAYLHPLQSVVDSNRKKKELQLFALLDGMDLQLQILPAKCPGKHFGGMILKLNYSNGLFILKINQMCG